MPAKELVAASIQNSTLCYGIYDGNPVHGEARQVGFACVISDLVRFSWLGDVFVVPEYRGKELGKWLISVIVEHPKLNMARPLNWEAVYDGYGLKESK
ncbi:GNAT family N-acetyltransferase [Paenibacillus beijingensis]|uniref:GNAT family N-acetyltransferase n=1 Tax=Paenibacillus beijingensis TaxID=1126833 RepID=UPI001EE75E7D|nr:GNAT family N-acetyltransferase [Paenibacillus beijingensis]